MSIGKKVALGVALTLAVAWLGLLAAGVWAYHSYGTLRVSVREHGDRMSFAVPGALVHWSMSAVEANHRLHRGFFSRGPLAPHHAELINALLEELSNCPDGVYVEVETANGDQVKIAKRDGVLEIRADDGADSVRVSVPTALAKRALQFASAAGRT